jgi:MraZ protein
MALFLSTHVNKVDKKGRVSVPAQFRTAVVGQSFPGIVAFRSFSLRVIDAAGIDRMEKYSTEIDTLEEGSARYEEVRAMLADARQLAFDGEGRIVLPADLAQFAQIGDECAFVGQGRHFYICEPSVARRMVEETLSRKHGARATQGSTGGRGA